MTPFRQSLALLTFVAFGLPFVASAQTAQTVEPTETQLRYNDEGVLKMQGNDYDGAVALFQSSLALGELNVTYLNLGRSFYRLERCLEAREAYARVESSPAVPAPTRAEIATALRKFQAELDEVCTGTIIFVCEETSKVAIDESKPRVCDGELAWPVTPGEHVATRTDAPASERVTDPDGKSVTVNLVPEVASRSDVATGTTDSNDTTDSEVKISAPPAETDMRASTIFGWFALGSGAVMLGTGLLVDQTIISSSVEDVEQRSRGNSLEAYQAAVDTLESQQTLNTIVFATGAVLTVVGVTLLLWPKPENSESVNLTPVISKDGVGVQAGFNW